jgi:hypothetical protein
MSRVLSLAGFQVILIGRFWVTTEERLKEFQFQFFQFERKLGRDYQVAARQRTVGTSAKGYKDGQIKRVEDYVCICDAALPKNQRKSRLGKLNHAASCTLYFCSGNSGTDGTFSDVV